MKTLLFSLSLLATQSFAHVCEDLPIGGSFVRNVSYKSSETSLSQNYAVHRVDETSYEVIVNPVFVGEAREQEARMRKRVESCLEKKSTSYSKDGNVVLRFKLYDSSVDRSKINESISPVAVRVQVRSGRAFSDLYPGNIDCKTIVHEVLHLTGLVDEYRELNRNEADMFPSRAIGPSNSVMASNGTYIILGLSTAGKLYPAHVRHILYPGCEEKNELYYRCAKLAYRELGARSKPEGCEKKSWLD